MLGNESMIAERDGERVCGVCVQGLRADLTVMVRTRAKIVFLLSPGA